MVPADAHFPDFLLCHRFHVCVRELHLQELMVQVSGFENNYFTEMGSGSETGSYLRLVDSFITQLKAQGPSRTCNQRVKKKQLSGREADRGATPGR